MADVSYYLGEVLRPAGKLVEALAAARTSLRMREELASEQPDMMNHAGSQARAHYLIGAILADLGDSAVPSRPISRLLGNTHSSSPLCPKRMNLRRDLAASYHNVGNLLSELGRSAEAAEAFRRAITVREGTLPRLPREPRLPERRWWELA